MSRLDKMLAENATQQQIEQALDQVCNAAPSTVKQDCESFVKQFTPELIQVLLQVKPKQVCSRLGLCSNQSRVATNRNLQASAGCIVCEAVVKEFENLVNQNTSKSNIEAFLDQVCTLVPSNLKGQCDQLVATFTPEVLDLLLKISPDQWCSSLRVCAAAKKTKTVFLRSPVKAGPQCTICEFVMTEVDTILGENSTQGEIKSALEMVCNFLPASIKDVCDSFIEQYEPELIQLLLQVKPSQVCTYLGLCSSQKSVSSSLKAGPQCTICEFVMTELDTILGENSTQAEVESALEMVCNFLPASIKDVCDSFIEQYEPELIQLLLQVKPSQVCTYLGLCSSQKSVSSPLKAGPQCTICEFVMTEVDNMLSANATQAEIKAALENVCNFLPASIKDVCDSFIEQYEPELIQLLLQVKPSQVCTYLGLCSSQKSAVKASTECILCNFIMTQLDTILKENRTKTDIEAALGVVCGLLPASLRENCQAFITDYAPDVIDILLNYSPDQVCALLKVCPAKTSAKVKTHSDSDLCDFCKYVIQYLDNVLKDNATRQEIEQVVGEICAIVPANMRDVCDQFLDQGAEEIVDLLVQKLDPTQLCTSAGLCNNPSKFKARKVSIKKAAVNADANCEICKLVAQVLENKVAANATEDDIKSALDKVCSELPASVTGKCEQLVAEYTPELIDALLAFSPTQLCTAVHLCTSAKRPLVIQKAVESEAGCAICDIVLETLDGYIKANSTQTEIKAALDKVCVDLPALKSECEQFVAKYEPLIISLLLQETRPRQVCTVIGLCSNNKNEKVAAEKPKTILFSSEREQDQQVAGAADPAVYHQYCSSCKFLSFYMQTSMKESFWTSTYKAGMYEFCNLLETERDVCHLLMDMNADHVLGKARGFNFPEGFCQSIDLCEPRFIKASAHAMADRKSMPGKLLQGMASPAGASDAQCNSCKFLTSQLNAVVAQPFWQTQLETTLNQICELMESGKDVCQRIVTQNMASIVSRVGTQGWPEQYCQAINLCEAPASDAPAPVPTSSEVACSLCERMTATAQIFLKSGTPADQVQAYLVSACSTTLDATEQDQCLSIAKQYIPMVLHNLKDTDKPTSACQTANICGAS